MKLDLKPCDVTMRARPCGSEVEKLILREISPVQQIAWFEWMSVNMAADCSRHLLLLCVF